MNADEKFDAVVVGAGHNGLTCAGYLARSGFKNSGPRTTQYGGWP